MLRFAVFAPDCLLLSSIFMLKFLLKFHSKCWLSGSPIFQKFSVFPASRNMWTPPSNFFFVSHRHYASELNFIQTTQKSLLRTKEISKLNFRSNFSFGVNLICQQNYSFPLICIDTDRCRIANNRISSTKGSLRNTFRRCLKRFRLPPPYQLSILCKS